MKRYIKKIVNFYKFKFWNAERYARSIGVKIGKDCSIETKRFGSEPYLIEIGNNVQITNHVSFFNHGGGWVFRKKYPNFDTFGKIKIGNNVYIGNHVLIMPGVTLGNNIIIGAGSVVTKSVIDGSVVAGNPAKLINKTDVMLNKILAYNLNTKSMSYEEKKTFLLSLDDIKFIKKNLIKT